MKYPKECPAFKVVNTRYSYACKQGDVVEGVIEDDDDRVLSFYAVDEPWRTRGATYPEGHSNADLLPLTPAARAMLAIARGRR
jgi:hypothetical protein